MKKLLIFLAVLICLAPLISASKINLNQNLGYITNWEDTKYVSKNNIEVISKMELSLSPLSYNFTNNYTFEFNPWDPYYTDEPLDLKIRIFTYCDDFFSIPPNLNCKELKNAKDFEDEVVNSSYGWKQKEHRIRIFQNEPMESWQNYYILITYTQKDIVKSDKGQNYYFWLHRVCISSYEQQKCPSGNGATETIILNKSNFELVEYPEYAHIDSLPEGKESVKIEGLNRYRIKFIDTKETEFWTPLKWNALSAFFGALLGVIIFNPEKLKKTINHLKRKLRENKNAHRKP